MARGGSRGRRNYTRDNNGRFASTPGGGAARSAKPRRGALKPGGGTLTARARLRAARAKLTPAATRGSYSGALRQRAQKAAVTRASNRLKAAKQPLRMRTTATGKRDRIAMGGRGVRGTVARSLAAMQGKKAAACNGVAASPRRLNGAERALASVMANSKFRSDASKRREMARLGFPVDQEQMLRLGLRVRSKVGVPATTDRKTARQALDRATGTAKPARGSRKSAAKPAAPQGPKLLPPAKGGRDRQGQRQRAEARAIANYNRSIKAQPESKQQAGRAAVGQITATRAVEFLRGVKRIGPQRGITSRVLPKGFVPQVRPGVPVPKPEAAPTAKAAPARKPRAASKPKETRKPATTRPPVTRTGSDWAGRVNEASKSLRRSLSRMGGINARDAQLVADFYQAGRRQGGAGVVRFDPVAGGFSVTHGAYMDKSTIRNALTAAKQWAAAGRKATRKPKS